MNRKTTREQYDTIFDSMINGQRRQAINQAQEMGLDEIPEMLEYFIEELGRPEMVLDFAKSYFRIVRR